MIRSALLDRLKQKPASIPEDRWSGAGISGERYSPESRKDFVEAYRDRVWVQRCVNLIRDSANKVKPCAYRGEEKLDTHPLLDLFSRPNRRDPALMFFGATAFWSQVVGEWYWEVIPSRGGGIAELHPLRAHQVEIVPGSGGLAKSYLYDPNENGEKIEFEAAVPGRPKEKSVIAGRFYNPLDDWYGMPPLRGAKDDVVSEYYGVRYDHRFFRNSARPDIIIGFEGEMSGPQRAANKAEWTEFKGVDNSHRAAVMDGKPNITELGKTPRDVQYESGRKLAREGECGAFGVPPVLVGILDRATYSNYQEAEPIFWRGTMLPLLEFLASWTNFILVPFYDDVDYVEFDTEDVEALQEDEGEKVTRVSAGIAGGIWTPNEGREKFGEEEVDAPEADELHLPMSATPLGAEPDVAAPPPPPQNGTGDPAQVEVPVAE